MKRVSKSLYLIFGWIFVLLGAIGILLPLVPTTPFLIVAAFCFSNGSEKMHQWLISHPYLGPPIVDWTRYGVIRKQSKWLASFTVCSILGVTIAFVEVPIWIKALNALILVAVVVFIWTRPSEPPESSSTE